ncbi:MAG TPA: alpha/beta fold hydrolase [Streptosporangiaceae bacterium]
MIAEEDRWIRAFHSCPENEPQLFCFPHAGGSATYYFPLSRALAPDVAVFAVQYPGRQDRRNEPCVDNIPELANKVFEAIAQRAGGKFAFFGHSMGAIVAFEVARRFKQQTGTGPTWLFASGRRAPSQPLRAGIHLRDDIGIVAELRKVGGTDQRFFDDEEVMASVLPVIRNDYKAVETYNWEPGMRLDCPVTALIGDSDPQTTADDAAEWAQHSDGSFDLRIFPGGHFYLDSRLDDVTDTIFTALTGVPRAITPDGSGL